ncbi:MAG: UbiA family prenyltransferase [Candidatus Methanoperedens sp.]|nr:UbiA family prenyltransferase [Candidatus Methanoperedens sp.]MCZ7371833.1 UbiA family prenyltransferase [Candidatus Methanoperedens sp.]
MSDIKLKKFMGYRGWKVWTSYDMHICLLALFYVLIVDNLLRPLDSLFLISSLGFYFMYGFLINDFCDISYDIAAGKKRIIQGLPKVAFIGIILSVVLISALHLLYLNNILYTVIYIVSYLLATLYSALPIRFKARGFSGIIVNGLIEKGLPVLAIFSYFNHFKLDTLIFVQASFLIEVVEIITHQILDYEADLNTGVRTYVVDVGREKALKIYNNFICPISGSIVVFMSLFISINIPYAVFFVAAGFIGYPVLTLLILKGKLKREKKIIPLYFSCMYFLINNILPLFFAFILSLKNSLNVVLLLVALVSQYYILKYNLNSLKKKALIHFELFTDT